MIASVAAVLGAAIVTSKLLEEIRSRRANALHKRAELPQTTEEYISDGVVTAEDDTGARVRAFARPDEVELYLRDYPVHPGTVARGLVVLVHGLTTHSGIFKTFISHLLKNGLAVVTYDLRGHGKSGLVDGIPLYARSMEAHVQDFLAVLEFAQARHPGMRCFALGESLGGLIVTTALLRHPDHQAASPLKLNGVLLSGAVTTMPLPPAPVRWLMGGISNLFPKCKISERMMTSGEYRDAFGDPAAADAFEEDPLVVREPVRLKTAMAIAGASADVKRRVGSFKWPFLAVHGSCDERVPVETIQEFFSSAPSEDKALEVYPGAKHMLFYDTASVVERVFDDLTEWMLGRVDSLEAESTSG